MSIFNKIRNSHDLILKGVLTVVCIVCIVLIFPKEARFKYDFTKGRPWVQEELIAPFSFSILKTNAELEAEREAIRLDHKPFFEVKSGVASAQRTALAQKVRDTWNEAGPGQPGLFGRLLGNEGKPDDVEAQDVHIAAGRALLDAVYKKGIIKIADPIERQAKDFEITTLSERVEEERELGSFYTLPQALDYIEAALPDRRNDVAGEYLRELLAELLLPDVVYNEAMTGDRLRQKLDAVSPVHKLVEKGIRVIDKGEVVTEEKYQELISLKSEYEKQLGGSSHFYVILMGQILLVSMSIIILMLFIGLFRKDVFEDNRKVAFLLLMMVLMALIAAISQQINVSIWVLPLCLVPVLIRVFFDIRMAIFTHVIATSIIGFMAPNGFEYVFIQLVTGIAAVYNIVSLQKRSQLFVTALVIFGVYTLAYIGFATIQTGELTSIDWNMLLWFGSNALLTLLAYPLMYGFEKLFGFLSDVTLLELSNTNNPLLRELASKAPGTFQHSMQVANLAEEAVIEVGGNPLLVRTGALYHDIGKMTNPMFFIENQQGANPHDTLGYKESARIIVGHVLDGIELAKKNGLPEPIIDFIRTHHGTQVVKYFYNSFKRDHPNEEINVADFQYPGPMPFSAESAILMMADSVEAASRSLKEPNSENIGKLVDGLIDSQIADEQFGNAPITFRDVNVIKKLFKKRLMNIYHVRIEYPK